MSASTTVSALKEATTSLLYPSETDQPFDVFEWKAEGTLSKAKLIQLGEEDPRVKVTEVKLGAFFENLISVSAGDSASERADAASFQHLLDVLNEHLSNIRVFRVGQIEVNYYVVGTTASGTWAGVIAAATET